MSQHQLVESLDSVRHCPTCLAIYRSEFTRCPVDGAHIVFAETDPMIGVTVAEHYQIDELLGIGSSGRVYLAHHRRLSQRRFALKILFGDLAATSSARMRFTHEAESASRLAHPNLVSVVDFGKTPAGLLYLAMDFIEGPTLASLLSKHGALAQDRAVRMALQLCRGLAHAHDLGLIHRDFKPDNILVSSDAHGDVPRIVDFGIALSADDGDPRLTATGVTLGTPAYAAPEQTTDGEVDHRADLFALGVTLYEMLTGVLPFEGTMVEIMRQNATMNPPPMSERAPGVQVTPALQNVVLKLMARDPSQRYQTAREVLEALTELPRRVAAPSRPSSTVIPSLLPVASSTADRASPRTSAMMARPGTPPAMPTSGPGTTPHGMAGMRPSSPALRPSSPALSRPSSPALAVASRSSQQAISTAGSGRPSSPVLTGSGSGPTRAGAPSGPMLIPSSTQMRAVEPELPKRDSASRMHGDLAPLITPVARPRYGMWTLIAAMLAAAILSIAGVYAYQRLIAPPRQAPAGAAGASSTMRDDSPTTKPVTARGPTPLVVAAGAEVVPSARPAASAEVASSSQRAASPQPAAAAAQPAPATAALERRDRAEPATRREASRRRRTRAAGGLDSL